MSDEPVDYYDFDFPGIRGATPRSHQAPINLELLLHRAAAWRRRFVADHGPDYDNDPTYRLVRDLANALSAATKKG